MRSKPPVGEEVKMIPALPLVGKILVDLVASGVHAVVDGLPADLRVDVISRSGARGAGRS